MIDCTGGCPLDNYGNCDGGTLETGCKGACSKDGVNLKQILNVLVEEFILMDQVQQLDVLEQTTPQELVLCVGLITTVVNLVKHWQRGLEKYE